MAEITEWVKKVWKNRITEFPTRRTLTKEDGSSEIVTVTRNEGTVSEEGDAFDADTMNNLEERIDAGFTEVNRNLTNPTQLASEDIKNKTNTTIVFPESYDKYKQLIVRIGCNDARGQQCAFLYPYIGVNGFSLNWALEGDFSTYSYKIEGFLKNGNALEISTIRRGTSITELTIDIYGIKQY